MASEDTFLALVTSEHDDKPHFMEMLSASIRPLVELVTAEMEFPQDYDLDTAIGAQLDVIGQWVGISRYLPTPLTGVYFAFNTDGVGFNQGIWKGPYDPDTGLIALPDDYYRLLIRVKILNNHWNGATPSAYALFNTLFSNFGYNFFLEDPCDLSIRYGLIGPLGEPPALLKALFLGGLLDIKPIGVRIAAYLYQTVPGPLFAFNLNNQFFAGFNTGGWVKEVPN